MDFQSYFAGKKITVMGLGLLGGGVGDVAYLAESGAELVVTDMKSEEELSESLEKLKAFPAIHYTLGEHKEEDFVNRDMILVAPSVPMDAPYLETARTGGARLVGAAALFAELAKVPIIGVTGTRGKSTVTHMIHHVLEQVTGETVLLGGNVRGVSNLQLLNDVQTDSIAVMELDSWKLQGFGWAEISPQIAVFTNFMADHMDYYQGDMDAYFADKANIFKYQDPSGVLITTPEVFERAKQLTDITIGQEVVLVDESLIPDDTLLAMPGDHNRQNAALAMATLKSLSLTDDEIFAALASFPGVPGRLQYLGEIKDVKIYNDNNATEPNATMAGLKALGNKNHKNIVLIAGGADKGLELVQLIELMPQYCKQVVLLPGTGTDRLLAEAKNNPVNWNSEEGCQIVEGLEEAVAAGLDVAQPGDILLFSPAFASFGLFKNEYDRNDQFVELIQKHE